RPTTRRSHSPGIPASPPPSGDMGRLVGGPMAPSGRTPERGLSADEFCARFQAGTRVLWTLAAGLLGDPTEAEDVCQEAFLAAFAKRAEFEPGTNYLAWMARFIRNVCANELRKRARRQTTATDPLLLEQGGGPAVRGEPGLDPDRPERFDSEQFD